MFLIYLVKILNMKEIKSTKVNFKLLIFALYFTFYSILEGSLDFFNIFNVNFKYERN